MLIAGVLLSLAALFALAGLFQLWGSSLDARRFPPPGQRVDIGGRKLHARVTGAGSPTVVLEAGISASSINWMMMQSQLERLATICSYDRAGLGWSDSPAGRFDAAGMIADLASLLNRLNLPKPFVLVGHSYGGLLVRLYAERFPADVGGLVLVDPILECQWAKPTKLDERVRQSALLMTRWGAFLARFGIVRAATSSFVLRTGAVAAIAARNETAKGMLYRLTTEIGKLPPAILPVFRSQWCRPKNFQAMADHLSAVPGSFRALRGLKRSIPAIVISAGNVSAEGLAEHRSVAALYSQGEHVVADRSGHWVHFDRSDVVVEAVQRIVAKVRDEAGQA